MSSIASVKIHQSQFPANVQADLLQSIRSRAFNHKFHYDSHKQIQRWLTLHEACSPARNDPDAQSAYAECFNEIASLLDGEKEIHVISLGCGGGQKDQALLRRLAQPERRLSYTPIDVTPAMTLIARQAASAVVPPEACHPFVCDLAGADDLPEALDTQVAPTARRVILFFGMIPNFEPDVILPKLAALTQARDLLLFSANLAPGEDYDAGIRRILPQYDNPQTRVWLTTLPSDLGLDASPDDVRFEIASCPGAPEVKRVEASLTPRKDSTIRVADESVTIHAGESIRLFFSCRYTPNLLARLLSRRRLEVTRQWISASDEEGVFLCAKSAAGK